MTSISEVDAVPKSKKPSGKHFNNHQGWLSRIRISWLSIKLSHETFFYITNI